VRLVGVVGIVTGNRLASCRNSRAGVPLDGSGHPAVMVGDVV
jgi:hypothetical protein